MNQSTRHFVPDSAGRTDVYSGHGRGHSRARCAVLAWLILWFPLAQAHKVNMFTYVEGDRVFVEGYFADGKKAMNSKVEVFNSAGKKLLEGLTDEDGQFSFAIPKRSALRITLNASMGHRTEYTLPASELGGDEVLPASGNEPVTAQDSAGAENSAVEPTKVAIPSSSISQQQLERTVEKAVGKAIMPIIRELSELKERRSFSDIIGGIGFIVGLLGAFFFFSARKAPKSSSSSTNDAS